MALAPQGPASRCRLQGRPLCSWRPGWYRARPPPRPRSPARTAGASSKTHRTPDSTGRFFCSASPAAMKASKAVPEETAAWLTPGTSPDAGGVCRQATRQPFPPEVRSLPLPQPGCATASAQQAAGRAGRSNSAPGGTDPRGAAGGSPGLGQAAALADRSRRSLCPRARAALVLRCLLLCSARKAPWCVPLPAHGTSVGCESPVGVVILGVGGKK